MMMKHKWSTMLAAMALAAPALWADEPAPPKSESVHARLTYECHQLNGATEKSVTEIWVRGDFQRVEVSQLGGKIVNITRGESFYYYTIGEAQGIQGAVTDNSDDYLLLPKMIERVKQSAQKVGVETVEGVKCDRYEMQKPHKQETIWLSQGTQLPVKRFRRDTDATTITTIVQNAEINPKLGDKLFDLPAGVTFLKQ